MQIQLLNSVDKIITKVPTAVKKYVVGFQEKDGPYYEKNTKLNPKRMSNKTGKKKSDLVQ